MKKMFPVKKRKYSNNKWLAVGKYLAAANQVTLGAPAGLDGGDIRFIAGQGLTGGKDGDIVFELADGTELIRFDSEGKVAVLGEPVSFEKIRELLRNLKDPEPCSCTAQQLLNGGCICDGA